MALVLSTVGIYGVAYAITQRAHEVGLRVVATLVVVAVGASWLPARRATRVDRAEAMRGD
ncbi:MAG: hypothetical protein ABJD07_11075 [Gemmatimonadaceae bacterium]